MPGGVGVKGAARLPPIPINSRHRTSALFRDSPDRPLRSPLRSCMRRGLRDRSQRRRTFGRTPAQRDVRRTMAGVVSASSGRAESKGICAGPMVRGVRPPRSTAARRGDAKLRALRRHRAHRVSCEGRAPRGRHGPDALRRAPARLGGARRGGRSWCCPIGAVLLGQHHVVPGTSFLVLTAVAPSNDAARSAPRAVSLMRGFGPAPTEKGHHAPPSALHDARAAVRARPRGDGPSR